MATQTKQPNLWQRLPWQAQGGIILVAAGGTFLIGRKHYKEWKRKRDLKKMQQLYASTNIPITTAVTSANGVTGYAQSTINLATISDTIYDAFYNNDPMGWTEDEVKAADALSKVPKQYLTALADVYAQAHGKNLRQDFIKFVSDNPTEWNKVRDYFN
jgi:hypothetical protein